jgi:dipeptidyl aminopeptidase/acylaminoacyl peptidase
MRLPACRPLLLTLALAAAPAPARAQSRPIQLSDLAQQVRLSDPQLSPDGRSILLLVARPDYEQNRWDSDLSLVDAATGVLRPLTPERHRVTSPRWAPGGRRIAFLSPDSAGKPQLFVLPLAGGDARQLTEARRGVASFAWSPDGRRLAFTTEDEPAPRSGEERHNRSFEVGDNGYLATEAALPVHVWLVADEGGQAERITSGVAGVALERPDLAWSADGRWLAFLGKPRPESGEMAHSTIELLDLTTRTRRTVGGSAAFSVWVGFSPDSRLLAFKRERGDVPGFTPAGIFLAPVAGAAAGGPRDVTASIDHDMLVARWLPSGRELLIQGQEGASNVLWVQPLDGRPRRLALGSLQPGEISVAGSGAIAFIATEPQRPEELYLLPAPGSTPRRLTDLNAALGAFRLGRVDTLAWKGPEGQDEDGVVVYPPDFDPARKYPLVLNIHGGPMMGSTRGFAMRDQLLAARGWIVFNPNYRGSANLGAAYQRAIVGDAGDGPGRDVMAGVAALRRLGNVDETRMAVSGWSYGGFMTTWLASHYDVWRAAVAGAAVTDWFDYYDLADNNVWVAFGFGASPWVGGNEAAYRANSPITYAQKIRAPMLILSDVFDPRVPVTQSYKLYHALKDNGVETRFVLYPIGGHVPADPVTQRDINRRWIDWLATHLAARSADR